VNKFVELHGFIARSYRRGESIAQIRRKVWNTGMTSVEIARIVKESQIAVEFNREDKSEITIIVPSIINYNLYKL